MKTAIVRPPLVVAAAALCAVVPLRSVAATDTIAGMISEGDASLSLRYRFETVDQDNRLEDAEASTLKSRLTLETAEAAGFTALVEVDDVSTIGSDDYNSLMVDDEHFGTHSVVADPAGTEVNQAWLQYEFDGSTRATAGRQRILHADQRFVGGVGWRQNEQTYDALRVRFADTDITLDYSYIWSVNRIFDGSGTSVQPTEFDSRSHALLATAPLAGGEISGFVYALDFDEAPALSSITWGVGYSASFDPLSVDATLASQSDHGDNPESRETLYLALEGKLALEPATLVAGYELLGSDDGEAAFSTPLATLHKFQGWADVFLSTPADGLRDTYVGATGNMGKLSLGAFYHDFSADEGGDDYGRELDLVATYPLNKHLKTQLKYADYDADDYAVDTRKIWFSLMADF